jgi:hypothetical protein
VLSAAPAIAGAGRYLPGFAVGALLMGGVVTVLALTSPPGLSRWRAGRGR